MIIILAVMQIANMRTQYLWFTDAIIRASSIISRFWSEPVLSIKTLIATGILTFSFSGIHQPYNGFAT
jgi:hypothetical protein